LDPEDLKGLAQEGMGRSPETAALRGYLLKDLEVVEGLQMDLVLVIILFIEQSLVVLADLVDLLAVERLMVVIRIM
jgi:hypothetical protein